MSTASPSDRPSLATSGHRWHPNQHGWVVALPDQGDRADSPGQLAKPDYLAQVDDLLATSVAELGDLWTSELEDRGTVDILGGLDLPQLMNRILSTKGKRIRPVMAYLGWLSAGGHVVGTGQAEVVRAGAALELLHLFALIHDDVMDESTSRRGEPTVHALTARLHGLGGGRGSASRFGENIAILLGDLAHAEADHLVADLPGPMRKLWRLLVVELVCGQRRDLTGSAGGRRDLNHARQVARMKSGAYTVERPLQLGAAAANAAEPVIDCLTRYGRALGEAFALRDDLLGVWGDPARTGKPAGDDLVSGKPTVILSLAASMLRAPAARDALRRVGSASLTQSDVALLLDQLESAGVAAAVENLISGHVAAALDALEHSVLDPAGITELTQMAHQIAWRDR
ncbi:MAG TPA: polyprenyl synthetase family protein [Propionibacteriaceae bacterium]|nr:polyprenyl synthetase family protein [Propionibacteriaceae bacterium]